MINLSYFKPWEPYIFFKIVSFFIWTLLFTLFEDCLQFSVLSFVFLVKWKIWHHNSLLHFCSLLINSLENSHVGHEPFFRGGSGQDASRMHWCVISAVLMSLLTSLHCKKHHGNRSWSVGFVFCPQDGSLNDSLLCKTGRRHCVYSNFYISMVAQVTMLSETNRA